MMTRLGMARTVGMARGLVRAGHVRVGSEVVDDEGVLVTRGMEDWVTWVEGSRVKRAVERYKGEGDDFEGV